MGNPLITIGITCYREGDWLLECWQSVLAQTDDRWEAVLVMDGGADARTREIFDMLDHPRLRKHAMPENVGPYPVRNMAFTMTETPYHLYLDADDQLVPDSVALILAGFAREPNAGFVYGEYQLFGGRDEIVKLPRQYTTEDIVANRRVGPMAYSKALWSLLGGFTDLLARGLADYDFLIGAFERGYTGHHVGEVFYRYRVREQSVSKSYHLHVYKKHHIIVRRHPHFFSDKHLRETFLFRAYLHSSVSHARAGHRWRARLLIWRGRLLCGEWRHHIKAAVKRRTPAWLVWPYRAVRNFLRASREH